MRGNGGSNKLRLDGDRVTVKGKGIFDARINHFGTPGPPTFDCPSGPGNRSSLETFSSINSLTCFSRGKGKMVAMAQSADGQLQSELRDFLGNRTEARSAKNRISCLPKRFQAGPRFDLMHREKTHIKHQFPTL
jgi:hypothetical protein